MKRGWGLCCSKSCAAHKREKSKPRYDPERVAHNNFRRATWNSSYSADDEYPYDEYPYSKDDIANYEDDRYVKYGD